MSNMFENISRVKSLVAQLAPLDVSNEDIQSSNPPSPIATIELSREREREREREGKIYISRMLLNIICMVTS